MREIVSAATGRNIREILATEILDPLGFRWTNYGVAAQDVPLVRPATRPAGRCLHRWKKVFQPGDRRIDAEDHPVLELSAVPDQRAALVQHHLDGRRAVALRRDPAAGRGTRRGAGDRASRRFGVRSSECRRLRPDVATGLVPLRWGTGYMLGSNRFGPFGRNAPAAFGNTGLRTSRCGPTPSGTGCRSDQQRQARRASRGQAVSGADGPHRRRATAAG